MKCGEQLEHEGGKLKPCNMDVQEPPHVSPDGVLICAYHACVVSKGQCSRCEQPLDVHQTFTATEGEHRGKALCLKCCAAEMKPATESKP